MSHRSALQSRHLAERPEQAGGAHEHEPADQPDPETARVVVRRELRREAVERVREARGDRHQEARAARRAAQTERQEGEDGEDRERHPEARTFAVRRVASGGRDGEEWDSAGHRDGSEDLAPSDVLVELADGDEEEEDERHAEQRLDERERRLRERERLTEPAGDAEGRPGDPARTADEPPEEGQTKRALGRLLPGLERLQPHPEREQRRGAEGGENAGQKGGHELRRP